VKEVGDISIFYFSSKVEQILHLDFYSPGKLTGVVMNGENVGIVRC
jgi:hypothetical protein